MEKTLETNPGVMRSIDETTEGEAKEISTQNSKQNLLNEKKEKVFTPKTNSWIASAFISCLLFACSNLFLSMYSENWSQTRELAYIGVFIYSITYFFVKFLLTKDTNYFDFKSSMFYDKESSKVNFKVIIGVIISTFFQVITGYTTIFAMEFSECAGINKGVITTLFAFNSVLMSVYAWLMLNEKISGFHVFGLGSIVTCVSLLGFNDTSNSRHYHIDESIFFEIKESCSSIYAIGFGLLTSILFCVRVIVLKPLILKFKISSSSINAMSQFICGIIFTSVVLLKYNIYEIDMYYCSICLLSGVLYCFGILAIYHSYSTGYVGPSTAISSMVSIPQTIITAAITAEVPTNYQIASMSVGVFGCVAVSIGPLILDKFAKVKLK